ncbi:Fyve finger-containing protein, partial [Globisporangium polare]
MSDPFFDEDDDGDFDDLYGNAPNKRARGRVTTTTAQPTRSHYVEANAHARQHQPPVSGRSSVDNGAYSYPVSPVSSIPSTTYSRSDAGGVTPGGAVTPGGRVSEAASRRAAKQAMKQKAKAAKAAKSAQSSGRNAGAVGVLAGAREQKTRQRKGSEELFNVDWEDDDAVKACFLCSSSFSLMRRKHHCRHCGRVMCSDCSVFRYFEISRKKHRVCSPCNNELARANRLTDSDARESFDRSVVTDDDVHATPSGSSGKKRGKLRENLKKTFTPKHDKKKEDRQSVARPEKKSEVVQRKTDTPAQVARPKQRKDDGRNQAGDLFDLDDDTWFADPVVGENGSANKNDRKLHIDDLNEDFMRSSVAQPQQQTAADEWQDETNRHTVAASGGALVPKTTRQDSLSIDAYASRGDDEYDIMQRGGMEMPRPKQRTAADEWQDTNGRQTTGGARVPKTTRQDSLSIDAYASRGDDEYDI